MTILVSFLVEAPFSDPHGFKVYTDGQVDSYRTSRRVKNAEGIYVTEELPPDWYPLMTLAPAARARIEAAVEALKPIPDAIPSEGRSNDLVTWQFGDHTLEFAWEPLPDAAEPYLLLTHLIGEEVLRGMA